MTKFTNQAARLKEAKRENKLLREKLDAVVSAMQRANIDCEFLDDRVSIYIHDHAEVIEQVCRITGSNPKLATVGGCLIALVRMPGVAVEERR
jgi:hypothetical protein